MYKVLFNNLFFFIISHPNGGSFVRLEKVIPCNVSFMDALKNKYGQHGDPGFNQEISALVKQSKMSFFEFVGVNKIQTKLA